MEHKLLSHSIAIDHNVYAVFFASSNAYYINRNRQTYIILLRNKDNGIKVIKWDSAVKRYMEFMRLTTNFDEVAAESGLIDKIITAAADR